MGAKGCILRWARWTRSPQKNYVLPRPESESKRHIYIELSVHRINASSLCLIHIPIYYDSCPDLLWFMFCIATCLPEGLNVYKYADYEVSLYQVLNNSYKFAIPVVPQHSTYALQEDAMGCRIWQKADFAFYCCWLILVVLYLLSCSPYLWEISKYSNLFHCGQTTRTTLDIQRIPV